MTKPKRDSHGARKTASEHYPYMCCAVCGMTTALDVCHLDNDRSNNQPDNLVYLCKTHHWMFDGGLYPIEAVKMLRNNWQKTEGKLDTKIRMKGAGEKAALTRKRKAAARKAVETRRRNAELRRQKN